MAENKIIRPPRHISRKVPKSGGPTPEQAILRALNGAEDLIGAYQGWAVDDLEELWAKFSNVDAEHRASREDIDAMFNVAHEIRGQGGTFGFPLISVIADSLCKLLDTRTALGAVSLEGVKVHILAMKAEFRQQLKGDQVTLAKDLRALLEALRDKLGDR